MAKNSPRLVQAPYKQRRYGGSSEAMEISCLFVLCLSSGLHMGRHVARLNINFEKTRGKALARLD